MTIYVTKSTMWKTQTWNDIDKSELGWTNFSFFNQLYNLNLLSNGSVNKSVSRRQFGVQQVGILVVFLLLKTFKDIYEMIHRTKHW